MSATSTGSHRGGARLWLRWSFRDLRARWLQVTAIALIIALGTGSYAGLSSVTRWRRASTDAGYESLRMYDLRLQVVEGGTVGTGELEAAVNDIPDRDAVAQSEERLIADIQVDASTPDKTILVPGALYGVSLSEGNHINALHAISGRLLTPDESGADVGMLERNFARHYDLPSIGRIVTSGGHTLEYVGHASTPEYFLVTTERGDLLAEANFAAVFTSLETAQRLLGRPGAVNDLVLVLADGANRDAVKSQIEASVAAAIPSVGVEVTTRAEDPSFLLNDRDIEGDQQLYDIFALLIFAGAIGAAFNLTARVVESQRREIGIAMAMGVPPWRIAVRPMLLGAEIALLGVAFGAVAGYGLGQLMMMLVRDLQPLPQWDTPFQLQLFAGVAIAGFVLPLVATAWPVWRAVAVTPVEAIRPAYRATQGRLRPLTRYLRVPGSTFIALPIRNIVRAPRRTFLTALGIAASLAALVAFVGMIDSFLDTTSRGDRELLGNTPNRLEVGFASFYPTGAPAIRAVLESPLVAQAEPGARLGGTVRRGNRELEVEIRIMNIDSDVWQPTLVAGSRDRETPGIFLSELAAKQLGAQPGTTVQLEHPRVDASGSLTFVESDLVVLGIHPHPFRFVSYVDVNQFSLFAPLPFANTATLVPGEGVSPDELKRDLFVLEGVTSIQEVGATARAIRDFLDEFVIVLRVVEGAMLAIAFLIAYNASSINMDERSREHATMFAFGVPILTVLRMAVVESFVVGLAATAAGIAGGWVLLRILLTTRVEDTLPDIYIKATISPTTLAIALVLGVFVVAFAPLLQWRRLAAMDVPSTLKVME
jgi:putative ABC transport system permease protein